MQLLDRNSMGFLMSNLVPSTALTLFTQSRGLERLPDNAQYTNRFHIRSESSDRLYVVAQRKTDAEFTCGCPGWIYKRAGQPRGCKHLRVIVPALQALCVAPTYRKPVARIVGLGE